MQHEHEVMMQHEDGTMRPIIGGNCGMNWLKAAGRMKRLNFAHSLPRPGTTAQAVIVTRIVQD